MSKLVKQYRDAEDIRSIINSDKVAGYFSAGQRELIIWSLAIAVGTAIEIDRLEREGKKTG